MESTGNITSWTDTIADMGALYPFVGLEWLFLILCLVFWVGWHVLQMVMENRNYAADRDILQRNGNMDRALKGERILRPM